MRAIRRSNIRHLIAGDDYHPPGAKSELPLAQLSAGKNRQSGILNLCSSARKQMCIRPSGDGKEAKPRGTQIRRVPTATCKSPRASLSMLSAGMQSRLEQQSFGYHE